MTDHRIRSGSLQFYPRVRAGKDIPSVNWKNVGKINRSKKGVGMVGFVGYKVGMCSASAKDITSDSMTKGKKIIIPCTIIECPVMKIYSVRFYKNGVVAGDIAVSNEKILNKKIKISNQAKKLEDFKQDYEDIRVVAYSDVVNAGFARKSPVLIELGLSGRKEDKLKFVQEKIGKEIHINEVFNDTEEVVDVHSVSKGFGTQGPVKRFGITLRSHKSEKGRRGPGSIAPWHPARLTFRTPLAGQTGYHSRVVYNNLVLKIGKISEKNINPKQGFHKYGNIKTDFIILRGSIPGTKKRAVMITPSTRASKKISKLKFENVELI
jgi:large subunit ribosomal protein L3